MAKQEASADAWTQGSFRGIVRHQEAAANNVTWFIIGAVAEAPLSRT
jgi:hypothetical protein